MDVTLPQEQAHGSSAPLLVPLYQSCRLTPNENIPPINPTNLGATRSVTFELAPDNCMNFSKFLLEYDISYKPTDDVGGGEEDEDENPDQRYLCTYNTFNIAYLRVYNTSGMNLLLLDDTYNHYRDLMTLLVRKTRNIKRQKYYFDGVMLSSEQDNVADNVFVEGNEPRVIHVKIPFQELWNTLLSCKTDLFFGEKIFITIKWGLLSNFGCYAHGLERDENSQMLIAGNTKPFVTEDVTISNIYLNAVYNQDTSCNENTCNYCLKHAIDLNDFHCITYTQQYTGANYNINYQFSLNSSLGPYVKYILYYAYEQGNNRPIHYGVPWNDNEGKDCYYRWCINDYPYTINFVNPNNYENYQTLSSILEDSWYDRFVDVDWPNKFIDILKFSDADLVNVTNRVGRSLDTEIKISFEGKNPNWVGKTIIHRFYVITGRAVKINSSGIETIV